MYTKYGYILAKKTTTLKMCRKGAYGKEHGFTFVSKCKAFCMDCQKTADSNKEKKSETGQKNDVVSGVNKIMRGVSQVIKESPNKKETD